MPWFRPIFFIKIVSAVFEIFRKKEAKNHTLYSKVKKEKKIVYVNVPNEFFEI